MKLSYFAKNIFEQTRLKKISNLITPLWHRFESFSFSLIRFSQTHFYTMKSTLRKSVAWIRNRPWQSRFHNKIDFCKVGFIPMKLTTGKSFYGLKSPRFCKRRLCSLETEHDKVIFVREKMVFPGSFPTLLGALSVYIKFCSILPYISCSPLCHAKVISCRPIMPDKVISCSPIKQSYLDLPIMPRSYHYI